jgi:hypothetical protein
MTHLNQVGLLLGSQTKPNIRNPIHELFNRKKKKKKKRRSVKMKTRKNPVYKTHRHQIPINPQRFSILPPQNRKLIHRLSLHRNQQQTDKIRQPAVKQRNLNSRHWVISKSTEGYCVGGGHVGFG